MTEDTIMHRDIKPDNILIDENYNLKIADFGLARKFEERMTGGLGTPHYRAPEIRISNAIREGNVVSEADAMKEYNAKCDVWSAGLILYEMLGGGHWKTHPSTTSKI
jgi:serine/threonine protein kinase